MWVNASWSVHCEELVLMTYLLSGKLFKHVHFSKRTFFFTFSIKTWVSAVCDSFWIIIAKCRMLKKKRKKIICTVYVISHLYLYLPLKILIWNSHNPQIHLGCFMQCLTKYPDFQNMTSDNLNYAALNFQKKTKRSCRPVTQREQEPHVVYAATR